MAKTAEGWNKLYRRGPVSDGSRVKLRVTEKSKARSWRRMPRQAHAMDLWRQQNHARTNADISMIYASPPKADRVPRSPFGNCE